MDKKTKLCIGLLTCAVGFACVSLGDEPDKHLSSIRTERLVIVNAKGEEVATISHLADGFQGIGLTFGSRKSQLSISPVNNDSLSLQLSTLSHSTTVGLFLGKDTAVFEIGKGRKDKCHVSIGCDSKGQPFLQLVDDNGKSVPPSTSQPALDFFPSRPGDKK